MTLSILPFLDLVSVIWFLLFWFCYTYFADNSRWSSNSLTHKINRYREDWMMEMINRDMRMVDTTILGNLMTGIAFFASTAMLILGGTVALLGDATQAYEAIKNLPFAADSTPALWEIKILFLALIFIYAFFKFAWAFRLTNYCNIMVGSAPTRDADRIKAQSHAKRTAQISCRAGHHFNRGLRAYFFGTVALGWLFHPLLMAGGATVVVIVLYRREFSSTALLALQD